MKLKFRILVMMSILGLIWFDGCQPEDIIIIPDPSGIKSGSILADLVQRTTMRDGSGDNLIDNSSCTSLELPAMVSVNGQEMMLDSPEDFIIVESIIDEFDDDDIIEIHFPVTVVLSDHSKILVNTKDEFERLIDKCMEYGSDDDIECIDFVYPVKVSSFNSKSGLTEMITINDDKDLFGLFHDFAENDVVSFQFPISVRLPGGIKYVANNEQLQSHLENAIDACDEDDDNDHNDDDEDDSGLQSALMGHCYLITYSGVCYYFDPSTPLDNTATYSGYVFSFREDGTIVAINQGLKQSGTWKTYGEDGNLWLKLDFGPQYTGLKPCNNLTAIWQISEFWHFSYGINSTHIAMRANFGTGENGGWGQFLTIERIPLSEILMDGTWIVTNYTSLGEDKTADFTGFSLEFTDENWAIATRNENESILLGMWSVYTNLGKELLNVSFDDMPMYEISGLWDIQDLQYNRQVKFTRYNERDEMVLEKDGP